MSERETVEQLVLDIEGMTCAACAARIERVVGRMDGVEQISVNLALNRASVSVIPERIGIGQIESKIEMLGFGIRQKNPASAVSDDQAGSAEIRRTGVLFLGSLLCMLPFVWAMAPHHVWTASLPVPSLFANPWFQLALATPAQFIFGLPLYRRAFLALRGGSANMETLVVLGTSAAYLYSHYLLFHPGAMGAGHAHGGPAHSVPLYFDAGVMIVTVVWLGKWLEAVARKRTLGSLRQLHELKPETVRVERQGREQRIPYAELVRGDMLPVRPGEMIPVDGWVAEGRAAVNESLLSGESMPVNKGPGDRITGGTVNLDGMLKIQADGIGESATLEQMIRLMEAAQASKPPVQRLADAISGVFVPVIIVLAAATYAAWSLVLEPGHTGGALEKAMAVLLIACPCALGLATPTSILVGSGRAARQGILFKEGKTLEAMPRVRMLLLDKTGTLTAGVPKLSGILAAGWPERSLLRLTAAAERHSEHPLARSIAAAAEREGLTLPDCERFEAVPGCGVRAAVEGREVLAGSRRWLLEQGASAVPEPGGHTGRWEREGRSVVFVAIDGRWAGALALSDAVRPSARQAVRQLTALGMQVMMVTGDHRGTAEAAARQTGIRQVHAEMRPGDKVALIRRLQEQGHRIAMVGDGINDAPALTAADVGIAVARGTDMTKAAADIVLLKNDMNGIVRTLSISRRTMRVIRQNLGFSLLYNTLAVPFAAAGYMAPWMACTAMAFSSVTVLCNALRLRRA